jgi:hypothetical protein
MFQEFARFVELPSRATFLAARSAWLQLDVAPLTSAELQGVAQLLTAGEAAAVIEQVHAWKARAAFSPRAHYFAGEAHAQLGELDAAECERMVFTACLQGILATGDGSRRKPYLISQLPDEYDVLKLLGLTCEKQRLVQSGKRSCDVLSCHDGSQIWFNISDLLTLPTRETAPAQLPEKAPEKTLEQPLVQLQRSTSGLIRTKRRTSGRLRASPR